MGFFPRKNKILNFALCWIFFPLLTLQIRYYFIMHFTYSPLLFIPTFLCSELSHNKLPCKTVLTWFLSITFNYYLANVYFLLTVWNRTGRANRKLSLFGPHSIWKGLVPLWKWLITSYTCLYIVIQNKRKLFARITP